MTIVIRFNSAALDVEAERKNPINPIPGESLLRWLQERLRPALQITDPEPEDWGWYSNAVVGGSNYMLGSSASEPENGQREWVLQIVKHRSLKERLLGQGKLAAADPLAAQLVQVLSAEAGFQGVQVESSA